MINADIIHIIAVPNQKKIGNNTIALVALQAETNKLDTICYELVKQTNIHFVSLVFGRYDILIDVYVSTAEELMDFANNYLAKLEGIKNVEVFYISEVKKRTFGWLTEELLLENRNLWIKSAEG